MKIETAVLLISTADLSKEEIIKILFEYDDSLETYDAAFKTGKFDAQEILAYAKVANDESFWIMALNNLPSESKTKNLYFSVIKQLYDRNNLGFYTFLDTYFNFENMSCAEAIQTGEELSNLITDGDDMGIWNRILKAKNTFTKKQLLYISQIVKSSFILEDILKLLISKEATKKDLITLINNQWIGEELIISVLKSGKFSKKEMLTQLLRANHKVSIHSNSIGELFKIYQFDKNKALQVVRKLNLLEMWVAFQKTYKDYYSLLSEEELIYLLYQGQHEEKRKIIQILSSETLKRILMEKSDNSFMVGYIIESGKIDKTTALKAAEKVNWYSSWCSLINSSLFSDFEILDIVTNKVKNHKDSVWEVVCQTIDLSIFSFDQIMEMGINANSESVWPYIAKALKKRKEIKK